MARRTPTQAVPISEARRRLFELVDDVMTGRADRVALSHRAHDDEVVLVRARELTNLEAELAELRKRVGRAPRPFRGRIQLLIRPEELEADIARARARQAELVEAKLASFHSSLDPGGVDEPEAALPAGDARA